MIVHEFPNNIIYIENAFPNAKEFIEQIEQHENDPDTYSVVPPWDDWYDSIPVQNKDGKWETIEDNYTKGKQKLIDWDKTATNNNRIWPRPDLKFDDVAHKKVEETLNLIHEPYLKLLDVWYDKTGNKKLEWVSKNYLLRKYHIGGKIAPHIDKNRKNPKNTMDWSVLFYLNDDYEGGELYFPGLEIEIKPTAGSAIFFPCTAVHEAKALISGSKYYIFMVIHSEFNYSSGLREEYQELNKIILKYKGITDHPLLELGVSEFPQKIALSKNQLQTNTTSLKETEKE